MKEKMTKGLLVSNGKVEEVEKQCNENRTSLTLPFLTFIMPKGHTEHVASSSPVIL